MSQTEEEAILDHLKQVLSEQCLKGGQVARERRVFVEVSRDCIVDTITLLHSKGFTHLSTITGLELDDEIELIYHLMNEGIHLGLRTKVPLDDLVVPTLTNLIPGASLYEREIHDILDVTFEGHPNLTRLVLPDMWDQKVPPLRKKQTTEKEPIDVTPRKKGSRR